MEEGRRIFDAAQRKRLNPSLGPAGIKFLDPKIVHLIIQVERRGMADGALGLAVEQGFAAQLGCRRLRSDESPEAVQLRRRRPTDDRVEIAYAVGAGPIQLPAADL